jgi:hypothetical protein
MDSTPPGTFRMQARRTILGAMASHHVFLLSPASCHGKRARMLLREGAASELAIRLRNGGAPLADVFSFLSALYFRGKIAYARAFASPPAGAPAIGVITSSRGFVDPDCVLTTLDLEEFARTDIGMDSPAYLEALAASARDLAAAVGSDTRVVLLGSIATAKYVDPLRAVFARRLVFPVEFVGRGDMSRGGLMLRCAEDRRELEYVPVDDVPRHGARPPKLAPRRRPRSRNGG